MASNAKKGEINIENYNRLLSENQLLGEFLSKFQKKYEFPIESMLEIGTGTGTFLTKFLVLKERAKEIERFYGMEPISEFFDESKRHVVRLSRTDATAHEYFGGNPFQVITFSFVIGHIFPDKKRTFLKNIFNNLDDFADGRLVVMDSFIPDYKNDEDRKKKNNVFLEANIDFYKSQKNQYMVNYFRNVMTEQHDDYFYGDHKISIVKFQDLLKDVGFSNIKAELFKGRGKADWKKMGYYIITANR